jgi:DNA-binding MarR family transcriptional regulator
MGTTARASQRSPSRSPNDETWALLRGLLAQQRRRFLTVASELDMHPAQAGALLQMNADEPRPMHELAALLACDNSNVTGIIDRLEARGLVARQPYEQDRRVKHVVLTPLGAQLREQMSALIGRPPAGFERLSPSEQRQLRDLLSRALED